ncbi:hypothetical protein F2Q69_00059680 [Brassica cretica]|uniref:Uncharacterized protein n=1 Tax=Brassica cretica TaxID=69181 RepID=A0A8S9RIT5_BRACR|nr:hypothetical protein F2Q69_00059680 [Brassica cretica]
MPLVRACGAKMFVPWTLLERAEASCLFMLELNFHSGSSIYSIMSRDYVSGRGSRDVWTSDAALVGGGSVTSRLATQIVWGVGAETFAFDAALEGGASCFFMLELNFHSGSSITQVSDETDEQE